MISPEVPSADYGDPINNKLVGAWLLSEIGGYRPVDWSNKTRIDRATAGGFGGPAQIQGNYGIAWMFHGYEYINTTITGIQSLPSGTVSWWMNPTATNAGTQRSIMGASGSDEWIIQVFVDNNWYIGSYPSGSGRVVLASSPSNYVPGKWSQYTVTWSPTATLFYMNGVLIGSAGAQSTTPAPGIGWFLGSAYGGHDGFPGKLWNVRILSRAVAPSEARRLYAEPFAGIVAPRRRIISGISSGIFTVSWSDTHASSDATTATMLATASRSDSHASSDATTGAMLATTSPADTIASSDAITGIAVASSADTVATSDAITGRAVASPSDSVATSDATTGQSIASGTLADTLASSDSTTAIMVSFATLADSIVTSDLFSIVTSGVYTFNWTDSAATSDVSTASMLAAASPTDSVTTSDATTANMLVVVGVTDTAASSDATTGVGKGSAALLDTVATSDSATAVAAMTAAILDAVTSSDALTGGARAALADFLASSEGYATVVGMVANMTDTLAANDHLTGGMVIQVYPSVAAVMASKILSIARASPNVTITLAMLAKSIMLG